MENINATAPGIIIRNLKIEHDELYNSIIEEYDAAKPDINNGLVTLDPYRCNPLAALVCFHTEQLARIIVTIKDPILFQPDITFTYPKTEYVQDHIIPIAGLYPDTNNKIDFTVQYEDGSTEPTIEYTITTAPLPHSSVLLPTLSLPTDISVNPDAATQAPGFTFVAPQSAYLFGFDNTGVRWLLTGDYVNSEWSDIERISNGNFLVSFGFYELREVDILGRCLKQTVLKSRMHHDWFELENGQLLITTEDQDHPDNYVMDVTTIIDYPGSSNIVGEFRLREVLDTTRLAIPNVNAQAPTDEKDWFHNNRSVYDAATDSVIMSGRHQNTIISITAQAGDTTHSLLIDDINWIMGTHDNWGTEFQSKLLTPIDENGDSIDAITANADFWNWGQHSVTLPSDQPTEPDLIDLIIFNNGNYRSYDDALQVPASENYSECVRYQINTSAMTIQMIWRFGKELGSQYYGSFVGSVRDYNETYLVNHGGICLTQEGTNIGTHWGDPDNDGSISTISPRVVIYEVSKETREVVWAQEFSWDSYPYFLFFNFKAFREPMYPSSILG